MKCFIIEVVGLIVLLAIGSAEASWTTLDFPGAKDTSACGIDGNKIVGTYDGHGFLYDWITWTTIDKPGASATVITGIDGSNLVGYYYYRPGRSHGFFYNGTTWTTLDFPGAVVTAAYRIDGSNVVGYYEDYLGAPYWYVFRGFLYDGKTWTTFKKPGTGERTGTFIYGIDGVNIVGFSGTTGGSDNHGFLCNIANGTWTTIDFPGATNTRIYDIDGSNLVGYYEDGYRYEGQGFFYNMTSGIWTTLDVPGAKFTYAYGIDGDRIVGAYCDASGNIHGFVYEIPEPAVLLLFGLSGFALLRKRRNY